MAAEEVEQRVMVSNVYQCTACAREFKDKSLLTKHFNMEHAKIARECSIGDFIYFHYYSCSIVSTHPPDLSILFFPAHCAVKFWSPRLM